MILVFCLGLMPAASAWAASSGVKRYIIGFKPDSDVAARGQAFQALGATPVDALPELDAVVAEVPEQRFTIQSFESLALAQRSVALVEEDFVTNWLVGEPASFQSAPLPSWAAIKEAIPVFRSSAWTPPALPPGLSQEELPWGVQRVNAPAAWAKTQGAGVRVAVVDTGIDFNHPDLKANYAGCYNAMDAKKSCMDDNSHGTHVSGTIAGALDGKGVAGVAPQARLYAVKVLDADGSGGLVSIIKGILWCANNKMQVANMSLGAPIGTVFMRLAVKYAASKGVTIVAAAGNNGGSVGYPAGYPDAIAVSASDSRDKIASFSSRGPRVEFIAPGVDVKSSVPGGGTDSYDGTSMAAPHVAGLAALAVSRGARGLDGVRAALKRSAKSVGLKPTEEGAGMIDAALVAR
ncbi:MAG: S8 family peptidase [Elusimicrobia bacterium]|nr:S8 family peptidase [Elusimicrobiota bacterium]